MEEFLPGLVRMIEEKIGDYFATIIVWIIGITVFVGGLYYTITYTLKLSELISRLLARLLQAVPSLVRHMQARPGVRSAVRVARIIGPLDLADFVFILLQVLVGIGAVIAFSYATSTRLLPFVLIFQGAFALLIALREKGGSLKQ